MKFSLKFTFYLLFDIFLKKKKLFINIIFSDSTQRTSILMSFLSITFSAIKLFYSQRLGRYPDYDPSIKMIAFVALPVMILIAGPLTSVVCMAAYFQEKVFACILIIIVVNASVLKSPCLEDKLYPYTYLSNLYESYELEAVPEDVKTRAKQDKEAILITALFTSWISPCTVWANNIKCNSYFLLVSNSSTFY